MWGHSPKNARMPHICSWTHWIMGKAINMDPSHEMLHSKYSTSLVANKSENSHHNSHSQSSQAEFKNSAQTWYIRYISHVGFTFKKPKKKTNNGKNRSIEVEDVRLDRFCCPIGLTIAVQNLCAVLLSNLFWKVNSWNPVKIPRLYLLVLGKYYDLGPRKGTKDLVWNFQKPFSRESWFFTATRFHYKMGTQSHFVVTDVRPDIGFWSTIKNRNPFCSKGGWFRFKRHFVA